MVKRNETRPEHQRKIIKPYKTIGKDDLPEDTLTLEEYWRLRGGREERQADQ